MHVACVRANATVGFNSCNMVIQSHRDVFEPWACTNDRKKPVSFSVVALLPLHVSFAS